MSFEVCDFYEVPTPCLLSCFPDLFHSHPHFTSAGNLTSPRTDWSLLRSVFNSLRPTSRAFYLVDISASLTPAVSQFSVFSSLAGTFTEQNFKFWWRRNGFFSLMHCAFDVMSENSSPRARSQGAPVFSLCMSLWFVLRFNSRFCHLWMSTSSIVMETLSFRHWIPFAPLSKLQLAGFVWICFSCLFF